MPTITFDSATAIYNGRQILQPISADLREHRIGIIGANGSGKSTFARLINGLGAVSSGRVLVDGIDVAKKPKEVRRRVGFIFSDADNQIVMPSVAEDIAFSLRRHKMSRTERERRVHDVLHRFGLASHADDSPHLLSGGQKQLLALASVLVTKPEIIIADEPTTLLDLKNRLKIKQILNELDQQVIVVTHDLDFVQDFDRVIRIDDGRITDDGQPTEVIEAYIRDMQSAEPLEE